LKKPPYQSTAMVQIKSTVPDSQRLAHPDVVLPDYYAIIKAQMLAMSSADVIRSALSKPEWRSVRAGGEDEITSFSNNLEVTQDDPGSNVIKIVFSDTDPKVAKAGTNALVAAYLDWYQGHDPTDSANKRRLLEHDRDRLSEQLATSKYQLDQLAEPYGGTYDLQTYLQGEFEQLNKRESEVADAKLQVDRIQAALAEQAAGPKPGQIPTRDRTPEEIAQSDTNMRDLLTRKQTALQEIHRMQAQYGPNSPALQRASSDLDLLEFEIEQYARECNNIPRTSTLAASLGIVTPADLDHAKADYDRLVAAANAQRETVKKVGALFQQIQQRKDTIAQTQAAYDAKVSALNDLESQMNLEIDQVQVLDPGDLPAEPNEDRRMAMAAFGFLGGGMMPVCALLLIGLLDGRYRYSDETEARATGIPLLGILPSLPELSGDGLAFTVDAEQSAIAAHCVHQVRTLLQINGPDRRVYTVTSATSGDGKTSLSLSLGLSFAASGSRTLLIDADMVGAGLTARVGVRCDEGLLEAMAAGKINGFIHATEVENLSILPVGAATRRYAGTIAPAAVRRLIAEARNHYETVLIDTGPILGSIEASSVCAAADAVVLCVARGQQRGLSERAIAHLQAIGAKMAGVVFNRADAHDFERSVSRTVVHSLPAALQAAANGGAAPTNGKRASISRNNGSRMGPIAKAVASSVRPDAQTDAASSEVNEAP